MNLGSIFKKENQSVRAGDAVKVTDSGNKGERLMRLQNEIRNLKPGQTIQGTVVSRNGNSVQIELAQDFAISAKIDKSVSLALGQMMSFEVKSNSSSFMSLAPLYTNTANTATILRALTAAGLPETSANIEMVAKMMEEGMPIDKDSILNMSRMILDFPGQNPTSIIQMTRLELPVTLENIEQFEQYQNANHQILGSAETIMEELPQTFTALVNEGQGERALAFYSAVIEIFTDGGEEDGTVTLQQNGENAALPEGASQTASQTQTAENQAQTAGNVENAAAEELAQLAKALPGDLPEGASKEGQAVNTAAAVLEDGVQETAQESVLSKGQWERLGDALRDLGADEQTAAQVKSGELPAKEVLQLIRHLLNGAQRKDAPEPALQRLLGGNEFKELLKDQISRQWMIEPKDVADKKQVEQLYERIREQTARLSQVLENAGKGDAPVARSVQNLQSNVDFMNQMNQLFTYVQLPLKMTGNEAHGDLYVYTNKKSLAKKDGNVSALLHLDMEHLGPLDVYVTMQQNINKVSTNFTVQDEGTLNLIAKHIHILNERLEARGYSMKANFQVKEDSVTNMMQEILDQNKNISVLSKTSFDMRA